METWLWGSVDAIVKVSTYAHLMAQHLIQDDPEGPEVHFQPIRLLKQDFWSTVLGRADARRRGVASFLEPRSYAEVR
jgi:hypothetical protein